jgi:hypothetical protein
MKCGLIVAGIFAKDAESIQLCVNPDVQVQAVLALKDIEETVQTNVSFQNNVQAQ